MIKIPLALALGVALSALPAFAADTPAVDDENLTPAQTGTRIKQLTRMTVPGAEKTAETTGHVAEPMDEDLEALLAAALEAEKAE